MRQKLKISNFASSAPKTNNLSSLFELKNSKFFYLASPYVVQYTWRNQFTSLRWRATIPYFKSTVACIADGTNT